jgi:hypothetical protein
MSYDANGNMVNDGIHAYSWDARNQLVFIDSGGAASFAYDPSEKEQLRLFLDSL